MELKFQSALVQPSIEDIGSVGCGNQQDEVVNGRITVKTGWGTDAMGNVVAPDIGPQLAAPVKEAPEWISQMQLDLNDPANAEALDKIEVLLYFLLCNIEKYLFR